MMVSLEGAMLYAEDSCSICHLHDLIVALGRDGVPPLAPGGIIPRRRLFGGDAGGCRAAACLGQLAPLF